MEHFTCVFSMALFVSLPFAIVVTATSGPEPDGIVVVRVSLCHLCPRHFEVRIRRRVDMYTGIDYVHGSVVECFTRLS